jgi:hypothetical protein
MRTLMHTLLAHLYKPLCAGHTCVEMTFPAFLSSLAGLADTHEIPSKRRAGSSKGQRESCVWSKGTGYGGAGDSDQRAMDTARAKELKHDGELVGNLNTIVALLRAHSAAGIEGAASLPGVHGSLALYMLLVDSSLKSYIIQMLRNDSLLDIAQRVDLFDCILSILDLALHDEMLLCVLLNTPFHKHHRALLAAPAAAAAAAGVLPSPKSQAGRKRKVSAATTEAPAAVRDDWGSDTIFNLLERWKKMCKVYRRASTSSLAEDEATVVLDSLAERIVSLTSKMGVALRRLSPDLTGTPSAPSVCADSSEAQVVPQGSTGLSSAENDKLYEDEMRAL